MERKFKDFTFIDIENFKKKLLYVGMKYSNFCLLENNGYQFDKSIDCIAALGSISILFDTDQNGLREISAFQRSNKDWIFGHVAYDLKNKIEPLYSQNFDGIHFPDFLLFVPEIVIIFSGHTVSIGTLDKKDACLLVEEINSICVHSQLKVYDQPSLIPRFNQEEYFKTIAKIQEHIARGDCYEVCFCIEYYGNNCYIQPVEIYLQLNKLSPNPFSAFYKSGDTYLLCASPERYLKKQGNELISQPIKGTLKRSGKSSLTDNQEKEILLRNEKERAENIMIVDLVRNDLAKISKRGSVKVRNYLEIHSFPQVHQMISTISGEVDTNITFGDALRATFPMGSMTGAPKIKALELIEKYEKTRRGLFSGTIGYIRPNGDFDFNVVIRSLLYNEGSNYLSVQVGSAITSKSDSKREFEECNAKIEAMFQALK